MDENLTEQQQVESLKKLWKDYGFSVIAGIAIALILIFGWKYYHVYKERQLDRASIVYYRLNSSMLNKNVKDAVEQANMLISHYSSTPYADLAAFSLARISVANNNSSDAIAYLKRVINHTRTEGFKQIASIRLARIYLATKKPEFALNQLSSVEEGHFAALSDEIKGDAYLQQNKLNKAKVAYQNALNQLTKEKISRPILNMKIDELKVGG